MNHYFPVYNPIFMFTVPSVENAPMDFLNSTFATPLPAANIPDGIHTVDLTCMARCGFNRGTLFSFTYGP